MAKLTQAELERHLWQAADILRGTVDAGDYKQYIFGLLFYKRLCDVWDEEFEVLLAETGDREEAAAPDEHRFHIPPEHRWDQVRKQSTQIGQRLNNAFAAIEDANLRLRGVFGAVDFANQERFPDARLEMLLSHFEKIGLRNADVPADVLGDAYLYLITMFAEGAGKKGGEFYTPRQVVRLIVECLDPQPGMSIYDPTCGSAGMLLEAVQHLKDRGQNPRSLSLYGQEKNLGTWAIAQINLFLHGIDDAFIAKGDTILDPKRYDPKAKEFVAGVGAYDRVMANPPFSEKVWGYEVWANGDPFGRDMYGCPPKGYGDLAFVQHMVASLKDDGMLGVVVPHGLLFRSGAEGRIREAMLKADIIEAVIGLAPNLFYGAGIPAAILIVRKSKPEDRRGKVLIVNGDATFQPGKAQNVLTDENVRTLADAFHTFADAEKLARVVPLEEIEAKGWNLNIRRYVQTAADADVVDVPAEVDAFRDLIAKRNRAEAAVLETLAEMIEALGLEGAGETGLRAGWRTARIGDLGKVQAGRQRAPSFTQGTVRPYLRVANVFDGYIDTSDVLEMPFTDREFQEYKLVSGDMLLNEGQSIELVGRAAMYLGEPREACFQNTLVRFRASEISADFAHCLIRTLYWTGKLSEIASRTTSVAHLGVSRFANIQVAVPPLDEQRRMASLFDELCSSIDAGAAANNALRKLRPGIMAGLLLKPSPVAA